MTTKDRPILYCGSMVRALLDGSKLQTRRVVKPMHLKFFEQSAADMLGAWDKRPLPYGQPGDRLWVRETFFAYGRWETRFSAKKGRDEWHFIDMTLECGHQYAYAADGHSFAPHQRSAGVTPCWWKRPAIFMPRAASRITLEIVSVRVERLQDISEADAKAEGIATVMFRPDTGWPLCDGYMVGPDDGKTALETSAEKVYRNLWESINGPGLWDANPWVWVIEFKRVQP